MTKHETTAESLRAENERLREQLADIFKQVTEVQNNVRLLWSESQRAHIARRTEENTLREQRDALAEALREAMGWNWLEEEPPPEEVIQQCERALSESFPRDAPTRLIDALTRQGQEMGEYEAWVAYGDGGIPEDVSPAQLIEILGVRDDVWRIRADRHTWNPHSVHRLLRDSEGIPYCSAEGLESWCNYVATSYGPWVHQYQHKPSYDGEWWSNGGRSGPLAPDAHIKPGPPEQSLMRVWRGE